MCSRPNVLASALVVVVAFSLSGCGSSGGSTSPAPTADLTGQGTHFSVGSLEVFQPGAAAIADLDADGVADIVLAHQRIGSVTTFRGLGDGRLDSPSASPLHPGPLLSFSDDGFDLHPADLDGDGDLDLVVLEIESSELIVLIRDPAGTFIANPPVTVGALPVRGALADLDGDGDLDLITANALDVSLSILTNDGAGTFTLANTILAPSAPHDVAIEDIDADGDLDLVTAHPTTGSLRTWFGSGTLSFSLADSIAAGPAPERILLRDLDGDLDRETVVLDGSDGTVRVIWNASLSSTPVDLTVANGDGASDLAIADIDLDGFLDLVTLHPATEQVHCQLFDGTDAFPDLITTDLGWPAEHLALGRVDLDPNPDVVVTGNGAQLLRGDGTGAFRADDPQRESIPVPPPAISFDAPRAIALGDLDGDGDLDAVYDWSQSESVTVHLGDGSGGFSRLPHATPPTPPGVRGTRLVDLDGDGILDRLPLFVEAGTAAWFPGNGDGTFATAISLPAIATAAELRVHDVDGDGTIDLFVRDPSGLSIQRGLGSGLYAAASVIPDTQDTWARSLADLDGDGLLDLVVAFRAPFGSSEESRLEVRLGLGGGTFSTIVQTIIVPYPPEELLLEDFDGDGIVDLLEQDSELHVARFSPGTGSGTFGPSTTLPFSFANGGLVVCDANEDGLLDLISPGTSGHLLFLATGGGNFLPGVTYGGDPVRSLESLAVGDVDGDGSPDVVSLHRGLSTLPFPHSFQVNLNRTP